MVMPAAEVTAGVKALLARSLRDTGGLRPIEDDDDIVNGLGLDSLQMISFLLEVESHFGVVIDFESLDLAKLGSVREFAAFVGEQLLRRVS